VPGAVRVGVAFDLEPEVLGQLNGGGPDGANARRRTELPRLAVPPSRQLLMRRITRGFADAARKLVAQNSLAEMMRHERAAQPGQH
jgi:hypothetical protein